ncbi:MULTISPECIES: histidine phosphatase family protein [Bacillus]|uniref:Histidine phosphatase family protein n=2 Tax=Bacillus cereus group TaxID=86661 RepID=A0A4Y8TCX4_BACTU|nr:MULTISPECIES: histidine phosphatase family protein [Bacillus]KAA2392381.1 histidine phosphatase family protein [Bacillus cereus]KLA09053.1 hypothetical protein B4087_2565 [Bacillus cereus]KMP44089.1 phosphatase [Bacillus cereus]KXY03235.1 phosphatase [Bacillus cereus]MCG3788363.1 histidine phosphatase family protein [Bacillus sp. UTDS19-33BHI26]
MTVICLVRHGETDWNSVGRLQGREDIPLNEKGKKQANDCGLHLSKKEWDVIISSPLKRAKETAKIINIHTKILIEIEMREFVERDFGKASGLTVEERTKLYPNQKYEGQEEKEILIQRIITGLEKIQTCYKDRNIIVVAHGAVINAILAYLSKGEIGSGKTVLRNACISHIYNKENQWNIHTYNQISHLS